MSSRGFSGQKRIGAVDREKKDEGISGRARLRRWETWADEGRITAREAPGRLSTSERNSISHRVRREIGQSSVRMGFSEFKVFLLVQKTSTLSKGDRSE